MSSDITCLGFFLRVCSLDSFYISEYICKFYDLNTTYRLFAYSNMYLIIEIVINSNQSNYIYLENFFLNIVVSALKSKHKGEKKLILLESMSFLG